MKNPICFSIISLCFLFTSPAFAQIENEFLDFGNENCLRRIGDIWVNADESEFTTISHSTFPRSRDCQLVTFNEKFQKARSEDAVCGASEFEKFGNKSYQIALPYGADPGHSGGSGLGISVKDGSGAWEYKFLTEPDGKYHGFYKGVAAAAWSGGIHFSHDGVSAGVARLHFKGLKSHYQLIDSSRFFCISKDSLVVCDTSKTWYKSHFKNADSIYSFHLIPNSDGQILLNMRDSLVVIGRDLSIKQVFKPTLKAGGAIQNVFVTTEGIYVATNLRTTVGSYFVSSLMAYSRSFTPLWTKDFSGRRIKINEISEFGEYLLLNGSQGDFQFMKTLEQKSGNEHYPLTSFEIGKANTTVSADSTYYSLNFEVENTGLEKINSVSVITKMTWGNRDNLIYGQVLNGIDIDPGQTKWLRIERFETVEGGHLVSSVALGMPNNRTSGNGVQYVNNIEHGSTSINEGVSLQPIVQVSPRGFSVLESYDEDYKVFISDLGGRVVKVYDRPESETFNLPNGAYLLVYKGSQSQTYRKFIVY